MKFVEVERKFIVDDSNVIRDRILDLGAKSVGKLAQVDTYYNAPHRDFLSLSIVSEWLRLRSQGGKTSINYKRWLPLGAEDQTHCDEFETEVGDDETIKKLLMALDFKEMVVVSKIREEFVLGDSFLIALDNVEGLGSFVEFEYKGSGNVEEANLELDKLIKRIDLILGERDKRGYPYQLLGRKR